MRSKGREALFSVSPNEGTAVSGGLASFRASDWKLDQPDWTGRLRVTSKGKVAYVKLEDKVSGEGLARRAPEGGLPWAPAACGCSFGLSDNGRASFGRLLPGGLSKRSLRVAAGGREAGPVKDSGGFPLMESDAGATQSHL